MFDIRELVMVFYGGYHVVAIWPLSDGTGVCKRGRLLLRSKRVHINVHIAVICVYSITCRIFRVRFDADVNQQTNDIGVSTSCRLMHGARITGLQCFETTTIKE